MVVCIADVCLTEADWAATADPDWTHQQVAVAPVCNPSSTIVESSLQTSTPATLGSAVDALPLVGAFLRGNTWGAFLRGQTLGC